MPTRLKTACPIAASARTARGVDRLRRLQTTAADMFLNCGYEAVSVDDLIGLVGGSRRNVYGPYGGKRGLFVAAVRSICEEIPGQLTLLPMSESDLRPGLVLYGRRVLELVLQPRMLAMHRLMVSEGQRFPEQARSMCRTGRDAAATDFGRWLARHQGAGDLRTDVPAIDLAQHFFHLMVDGPQLKAMVGELPPGWATTDVGQHVDRVIELFLHGAGPRVGATSVSASASGHPACVAKTSTASRKTRR